MRNGTCPKISVAIFGQASRSSLYRWNSGNLTHMSSIVQKTFPTSIEFIYLYKSEVIQNHVVARRRHRDFSTAQLTTHFDIVAIQRKETARVENFLPPAKQEVAYLRVIIFIHAFYIQTLRAQSNLGPTTKTSIPLISSGAERSSSCLHWITCIVVYVIRIYSHHGRHS
jgi:hypothetical protein